MYPGAVAIDLTVAEAESVIGEAYCFVVPMPGKVCFRRWCNRFWRCQSRPLMVISWVGEIDASDGFISASIARCKV